MEHRRNSTESSVTVLLCKPHITNVLSVKVAFRNDRVILVGKTALITSFLHCSIFIICISLEKKKIENKILQFFVQQIKRHNFIAL